MNDLAFPFKAMYHFRRVETWDRTNNYRSFTGMAVVVLLHAAAALVLWQIGPVRTVLIEAAPMMVSLISEPDAEKPRTQPILFPVKMEAPPPPVLSLPVIAIAEVAAPTAITPPPKPAPAAAPIQKAAAPLPDVVPPRFDAAYLSNPPPVYPMISRRMHEQGRVLLQVLVSAAGDAAKVELKTSSGSSRLDQAALETVKNWRFIPAKQGQQPVDAWVLVPIAFALSS
jgi:periplasmic protein TonB